MKLAQLEYMVAIVEQGSLRAAARQLGLAQPALTRGVRVLEHELGTPLFLCEAKGMVLTPAGKLFHRRASAIVNDLRRAHEEVGQRLGAAPAIVCIRRPELPLTPAAEYFCDLLRRYSPQAA